MDLYPYLCIGIFFDLLNTIKTPSIPKREKIKGAKDKVTESGLMHQLCYALTNDDSFLGLRGTGSALSAIKHCSADYKGVFKFGKDGDICANFLYNYNYDYDGVIKRFTNLFEETITQNKGQIEIFFKQLIWVIKEDSTIDANEKFRTTYSEKNIVCKQNIDKITYLEMQPFVVSVLCYILTKTCNTNGRKTFETWFKQSGEKQSEYEFISPTDANKIHHIDIKLYYPAEESYRDADTPSLKESVATARVKHDSVSKSKANVHSVYEKNTSNGSLGNGYIPSGTRSKSSRSVDNLEKALKQLVVATDFSQFKAARLRLFQAIKIFVDEIQFPYIRNIDNYNDTWEIERPHYEGWFFRVLNYCRAEIEMSEQSDELTDIKITLLYDIKEWHFLSAMLRAQLDIEQLAFELSGEAIGKETRQTRIRKLKENHQIAQENASLAETSLDEKISGYENNLSADKTSL